MATFARVGRVQPSQMLTLFTARTLELSGRRCRVAAHAVCRITRMIGRGRYPRRAAEVTAFARERRRDMLDRIFTRCGQTRAVATRARCRGLNQTVIKRKRWLPRGRERFVARIAIVGGVQAIVMLTGFAAGRNAMAIRAIFHESGVVYRRTEKRRCALVAHAAIRRSNHVAKVFTFCFCAVVAERTGAACLCMQGGKISGDVWLFPIRKSDTCCGDVTNLAYV